MSGGLGCCGPIAGLGAFASTSDPLTTRRLAPYTYRRKLLECPGSETAKDVRAWKKCGLTAYFKRDPYLRAVLSGQARLNKKKARQAVRSIVAAVVNDDTMTCILREREDITPEDLETRLVNMIDTNWSMADQYSVSDTPTFETRTYGRSSLGCANE